MLKDYSTGYITLMPEDSDDDVTRTIIWFHRENSNSVAEYNAWTQRIKSKP